jgi:lipase chaperone LimK
VATLQPPHVPPAVQQLALGEVEAALGRLQFAPDGRLVLDAAAESALRAASDELSAGAPEDALARIVFLIHRQFPAQQAEQVEAVLRAYTQYRQQELVWRERRAAPRTAEEELKQLIALSELQDRVLGAALAARLYGEQRRLARYMLAARELERDGSLSADERQLRLQQLQRTIYAPDESKQP